MSMTWIEKDYRRDARTYGKIAAGYIANAVGFQEEAGRWRELVPDAIDRIRFWERRAGELQNEAVRYARLAARAAIRSQGE